MRRFACLMAVCATMLPLPSIAQVRIDALDVGVAGLAAAGPDLVATPGLIDDYIGNHDGIANPLETVRVEFGLWNVGAEEARGVRLAWDIDNPHASLGSNGRPSSVPVGDTGRVLFDTRISPDATSGDVTIVITVTADNGGPWRFIATFAIVAPSIRFAHEDTTVTDAAPPGDGDGIFEPGERLFVKLRLRNDGDEAATSARVSVTVVDPHATILAAEATHAEWPAGETRDTDFVIDLDAGYTAPELSLFFQVHADAWGPWQFSHVVPVAQPAPEFALVNAWVFDPAPGGNRDGRAVPGERIRPRVRLRNVAPADARNVEVTMTVDDPDVTVLRSLVVHDAWPAGEARNNDGLILRIASDAAPHDFVATVIVTADGGSGPWEFEVPFTIAAPDIRFAVARSWVFDPRPGGNGDNTASPGERVLTRVRVWNEGRDDAHGVSVILTSDDADVIVVAGEMTYERWPSGSAENNTGFVVDIAGDAQPHDAPIIVTITTGHGITSQFSVDIPIA